MANIKEITIKVENVSKTFKLPHEKQNSIKSLFLNIFSKKRTYEKQHVLKSVSFEVQKGEFFGIVGRNGSGKSTLLKLLAGIYESDKGSIQINGKLVPFIELGVGFNPELSGRENVFLNGALLGFNRKEMSAMYDEIVAFAELQKFMDQKLKNYSSGMQVRLAFSIAIRAESDILVLDEVLAVGDESFQRKCNEYFADLKGSGKTVILVTHNMEAVRKLCDRALLIRDGEVLASGDPDLVAEQYSKLNMPSRPKTEYEDKTNKIKVTYNDSYIVGDEMSVKIGWSKAGITGVGVALYKVTGERMFATNTAQDGVKITGKFTTFKLKLEVSQGEYYLRVRTFASNNSVSVGLIERTPHFTVNAEKNNTVDGLVLLKYSWEK